MTKHFKVLLIVALIVISGMYGWYLFATAVNDHADKVSTALIQDTLTSNIARDVKNLREIKKLISENKANEASSFIDKLIEDNIYLLEQCLTEKCNEYKSKVSVE
ncbi:hypothetical protein [Pseudoalteromonas sp. 2CM32C]|uniref:hypothetical protein n=1 Tax=Pseudoalteromonas sp. 2CM32C TaxID=2929852 RepID=UPI0020C026C8|nr:hypothetical protein [Pseudoalteromonas sp. 2CM32C]MCK8121362.1 hypothetical protein [Pseudoalteromonas sp. 2CM32C]